MTTLFDIPDIIYHYCGVSCFHGILSSKVIRLSDAYYMNDYLEHRWLLAKATAHLKNMSQTNAEYKEASDRLMDSYELAKLHPYIACFSKSPDCLSQWRAYSDDGAGFAIGFSTSGLMTRCDEHKANKVDVTLRPVEYDSNKQRKLLERVINPYLAEFARLWPKQPVTTDDYEHLTWNASRELWNEAALCKNPGFAEEEEFRLNLIPTLAAIPGARLHLAGVGTSELSCRVSGKRVIPFYKFAFTVDDIVEIRVGPKFPDRESHGGIEVLLREHGYKRTACEIINSKVSYQWLRRMPCRGEGLAKKTTSQLNPPYSSPRCSGDSLRGHRGRNSRPRDERRP